MNVGGTMGCLSSASMDRTMEMVMAPEMKSIGRGMQTEYYWT